MIQKEEMECLFPSSSFFAFGVLRKCENSSSAAPRTPHAAINYCRVPNPQENSRRTKRRRAKLPSTWFPADKGQSHVGLAFEDFCVHLSDSRAAFAHRVVRAFSPARKDVPFVVAITIKAEAFCAKRQKVLLQSSTALRSKEN